MAPSPPRLRILSVGGNAVSAFLSWRLQATNACDVTLVWKSGFETVSQYGISFKSNKFGNERFKPLHVVRAPEDAAGRKTAFDYVLLCVKALPDVYDLASVIESVVTPQHTCILVNTTHTLGIESHLEERFPTNVVLSLVSGAELSQLGPSEFEHTGATNIWVGPANSHSDIPPQIQNDMAEALAMTLSTGQVNCTVTSNICQQQFERMIGPIAFHPMSVLFETPSHAELIEKMGARQLINDVIEELLNIAQAKDCSFPADFKEQTIEEMLKPTEHNSTMYQDFISRRPMEVETYLGSPIKLGEESGLGVPRIATLYTIMHNLNIVNQTRPPPGASQPSVSPTGSANGLPPRTSSVGPGAGPRPPPHGPPNGMPNGMGRGRAASMGAPPPARRGGPPNGYPPRQNGHPPNGHPPRGPGSIQRQPSFENNDLEEFSHLAFIDDIPEGDVAPGYGAGAQDLAFRERELMLRQREIQLREQELNMRRSSRRPPPPPSHRGGFDEDDDDDEYVDPMNPRTPVPMIDPDNFDMMSVTSRRNRKASGPRAADFRRNPEMGGGPPPGPPNGRMSGMGGFRPGMNRNRSSTQRMMADGMNPGDPLAENPMMGYASNRYGAADRKQAYDDSRAGSLTRERLEQLQGAGGIPGMNGAYPTPRRTSLSPGDAMGGRRVSSRPSPPGYSNGGPMNGPMNGAGPMNGPPGPIGPPMNGRPSPPGMRAPVPRHPPGQGNAVAPQQFEQHAGVSKPYRPSNMRSLTGSASASAGSGESAHLDSENSAHSSQTSFVRRPVAGMQ